MKFLSMATRDVQARRFFAALALGTLLALDAGGCASDGNSAKPPEQPVARLSDAADDSAAGSTTAPTNAAGQRDNTAEWAAISQAMGRQGAVIDNVFRIVVPRDDLEVAIDSMAIPTAAGIESSFRFYRCSCGKMNAVGEFVLADYEANDVMSVLMQHQFIVSSMAPILMYDHPHLLSVRFQAEGKSADLAKALREALTWTGKERSAPSTQPDEAAK